MFARTERLLLRPCWPEDAQMVFHAVADEAIVRNLAFAPWPYSARDADAFVTTEHATHYPNFLLWQRTNGPPRLIGSCGIGNRNGDAELGYWIARSYWGLGYASEAAKAVVHIAKAIGHKHLVSGHFLDNPASGQVLHKAGFVATGKTEMRYSKGRGHAAACVLFEKSLGEEDAAGDMPASVHRCPLPYDVERIAA